VAGCRARQGGGRRAGWEPGEDAVVGELVQPSIAGVAACVPAAPARQDGHDRGYTELQAHSTQIALAGDGAVLLAASYERAEHGAEECMRRHLIRDDPPIRRQARPPATAPVGVEAVDDQHPRPHCQVLGLGREDAVAHAALSETLESCAEDRAVYEMEREACAGPPPRERRLASEQPHI
jgi:hypothetical protein